MKLQQRLKKALAITVVATTVACAIPVFAMDYTGHWAEAVITEWQDKGVIDGYEDGSFKPKQNVTRAELAKMLVEVFGLTNKEGAEKFTDIPDNAWYKEHVERVSAAGLMAGTDKNFGPNEMATREEAAYAVAHAYQLTGETDKTFKDQDAISEWAVEEVNALVAGGYINGYPDGTFKPQGLLTRAEMVTMLDKVTAEIINQSTTYTNDVAGHLVVNGKGVTLKDITINGNLYLAEGIGASHITLDNVTVTGKVIIQGAADIHIKGKSKLNDVKITKADKSLVNVQIQGTSKITGTIEVFSPAVFNGTAGTLPKVVVAGHADSVEFKGNVTVENLQVENKTKVTLTGTNTTIKSMTISEKAEETRIEGNGKVEHLEVHADKVKIDKTVEVKKEDIKTGTNVTIPPVIESSGGGGGGGGGGGSVTTPNLKLEEAQVKLTDGTIKTIKLDAGALHIDATGADIILNNTHFSPELEIESVIGKVQNSKQVTVSILPGTLDDVTLNADQSYKIEDLAKIVGERKDDAYKIVDTFVEQGALTAEQGSKAKGYLDQVIAIFEQSATEEYVKVSSIQHYIQRGKNKIETIGVDRINEELGKVLQIAGVTIKQTGQHIKVDFDLHLTGDKDSKKTIHVKLTF